MATRRGDVTARVVPMHSAEAGDSRMGGTTAERIAPVRALSEELSVHGVPCATVDLDIWIDPSPANAARVWKALADGRPKDLADIESLGAD